MYRITKRCYYPVYLAYPVIYLAYTPLENTNTN